ncbi:2-keto-4-pentenoate hydratase [Agrobacterium vitis]|nr:2-keto-4-pentenoate hydratase [Agrobacterium vitis]MBE1436315.1 2-keto-4-pentenoate hydratase [Agrobacterium vitis]
MTEHHALTIAAARQTNSLIEADSLNGLSLSQAFSIQNAVMAQLNQQAKIFKIALRGDGTAVGAPIFDSRCIQDGEAIAMSDAGYTGVEFELAVVLKTDITASMAAKGIEGILPAIERYIFGFEICATRFSNPQAGDPNAHLADNMSNSAFVAGDEDWAAGAEIDGASLVVTANGETLFSAEAKHPFGGTLKPILAYALADNDPIGLLKAGNIVTTGSLCGLLKAKLPAQIEASVDGGYKMSAELMFESIG